MSASKKRKLKVTMLCPKCGAAWTHFVSDDVLADEIYEAACKKCWENPEDKRS